MATLPVARRPLKKASHWIDQYANSGKSGSIGWKLSAAIESERESPDSV